MRAADGTGFVLFIPGGAGQPRLDAGEYRLSFRFRRDKRGVYPTSLVLSRIGASTDEVAYLDIPWTIAFWGAGLRSLADGSERLRGPRSPGSFARSYDVSTLALVSPPPEHVAQVGGRQGAPALVVAPVGRLRALEVALRLEQVGQAGRSVGVAAPAPLRALAPSRALTRNGWNLEAHRPRRYPRSPLT